MTEAEAEAWKLIWETVDDTVGFYLDCASRTRRLPDAVLAALQMWRERIKKLPGADAASEFQWKQLDSSLTLPDGRYFAINVEYDKDVGWSLMPIAQGASDDWNYRFVLVADDGEPVPFPRVPEIQEPDGEI